MKLSVQNHTMNNTNYALIHKTAFSGKTLTPKAFAAETEIIEKIKSLPRNVFEEKTEFLKFYKSIDVTPKISRAMTKRLAEVRQANAGSTKSLIDTSKRVVEGYKWLLNNCRQLSKDEIAEVTKISFDSNLPIDIRTNANELLKNTKIN